MKKNQFNRLVILALAFQLPILFAFGQDATLIIKTNGASTTIKCIGYTYTEKNASNAGSQSSGAGAGKAGAGSVVIQKAADNNTAALQQMLTNNENLPSVALEISKQDATGRSTVSQTIILSNANISQITHYGGSSVPAKAPGTAPVEEVTFTAQKIEFGTTGTTATTTTVPAASKVQTGYDIKANKKQ